NQLIISQNQLLKQQKLEQEKHHSLLRLTNTTVDSSEGQPAIVSNLNSSSMLNACGSAASKSGGPPVLGRA
ncbi:hypothetical protein XELAEV_18008437mg, partial [Xenopus laevis]